jgi:predicted RNA-binding Zn ribbon-like protein
MEVKSVAELPLVGGHPALDLVNTLERGVPVPGRERRDYLADPPALLLWASRAGLVDDAEAAAIAEAWQLDRGSAQAALSASRDIREALHASLLAATGMVPRDLAAQRAALERLHLRWTAAIGRSTLVLDPNRPPAVRLVVGTAPALLVPDRAADAALDLLRTADLARVRRCPPEHGGCGWIFLDRSRNGSRRWCRMADCGTQVKSRRLTERRRATRAAAAGRGSRRQPTSERAVEQSPNTN